MNDTIAIIIFVAIAVIVVGAIGYSIVTNRKRKAASWTGVVVDKAIQEQVQQNNYGTNQDGSQGMNIRLGGIGLGNNGMGQMGGVTHSYSISVRPDGGEVFNWPVSSGFYEAVSIGDRLSKPSGTLTPEIVERAPAPTQTSPVESPMTPPSVQSASPDVPTSPTQPPTTPL